jgi:hypothetical protein
MRGARHHQPVVEIDSIDAEARRPDQVFKRDGVANRRK